MINKKTDGNEQIDKIRSSLRKKKTAEKKKAETARVLKEIKIIILLKSRVWAKSYSAPYQPSFLLPFARQGGVEWQKFVSQSQIIISGYVSF